MFHAPVNAGGHPAGKQLGRRKDVEDPVDTSLSRSQWCAPAAERPALFDKTLPAF